MTNPYSSIPMEEAERRIAEEFPAQEPALLVHKLHSRLAGVTCPAEVVNGIWTPRVYVRDYDSIVRGIRAESEAAP